MLGFLCLNDLFSQAYIKRVGRASMHGQKFYLVYKIRRLSLTHGRSTDGPQKSSKVKLSAPKPFKKPQLPVGTPLAPISHQKAAKVK